jgi:hypothetical protein
MPEMRFNAWEVHMQGAREAFQRLGGTYEGYPRGVPTLWDTHGAYPQGVLTIFGYTWRVPARRSNDFGIHMARTREAF